MKYIRTKDRIIKIEYEWEYASCGGITVYNENENLYIADGDIIKTADTIEELCDEFVIFDDRKPFNEHYPFINNDCPSGFILAQDMVKAFENKHFVIYGAIWTDKGLIYVARMKGVLPNGEINWELL